MTADVVDSPTVDAETSGRRLVLRLLGKAAGAQMAVMLTSALLGIVVTRLIIEQYGEAAYGQYMLLVGIAALLPFADLGISAAIVNATSGAEDPRSDEHLRLTLVTCYRILAASSAVFLLTSLALTVSGAWESILGAGLIPGSGNVAAGLCLAIFGLNLLVSGGERMLNGLGRLHLAVFVRGVQTPVVLAIIAVAMVFHRDIGPYVAIAAYLGTLVASGTALTLANLWIRPNLGLAFRQAWRFRSAGGASVFNLAWPMLVQMIALPLAMQTDRIVLSHVAPGSALYEYSLASQMFGPAIVVVSTAGYALWPVFARARADGVEGAVSPKGMSVLFAGVGIAVALLVCALSGVLSDVASDGRISLGLPTLVAFTALVVVQSAKSPLGMYLTDEDGLRFQAVMVVLLLPVNLGLSILLAREWGATGPVVGSVISVFLFQILANWWYASRRQRIMEGIA